MLSIKNLKASIEDGTQILKGINLEVKPGEVHAIMGPNGSGKSTLSKVIAGHPAYTVNDGSVTLDGNLRPREFRLVHQHAVPHRNSGREQRGILADGAQFQARLPGA